MSNTGNAVEATEVAFDETAAGTPDPDSITLDDLDTEQVAADAPEDVEDEHTGEPANAMPTGLDTEVVAADPTPVTEPVSTSVDSAASDTGSAPAAASIPTQGSDGTDDTTPMAAPKPKRTGPTLQQIALGWEEIDLSTKNYYVQRQEGTPTVTAGTQTITKKIEKTRTVPKTVKAEDGTETTVQVEEKFSEDVPETVETKDVKYAWSDVKTQQGDVHGALTPALREQATVAKAFRTSGYNVHEDLKNEYGVWYVQDPEGVKVGYRYSIGLTDAPPKAVKAPKVSKEPKAPKEPKDPKAPKAPRAPKAAKAADVAAATQAEAKSDTIDLSDALD